MNQSAKICILDSNVIIDAPECASELIKNNNMVIIPWAVHKQLVSKKKATGLGKRAQKALENIDKLHSEKNPLLRIMGVNWTGIKDYKPANTLEKNAADDEIIATALTVYKDYEKQGNEMIFYTHDPGKKIKAREMKFNGTKCLTVKEWDRDRGDKIENLQMPIIKLRPEIIKDKSLKGVIPVDLIENALDIPENSGVLIQTEGEENSQITHVARRKRKNLILLPRDASIFNVTQRPVRINGTSEPNWEQIFAINSLLDLDLDYYAFIGEAGTGKTLLALSHAFHFLVKGNRKFDKVYITRAPVPFGKTLGFAPGSIEEKMGHWILGMIDNINIIKKLNPTMVKQIELLVNGKENDNEKKVGASNNILENNKGRRVEILSYEHIRGRSLENCIVIVDEVQNMNRQETTTFVTRLGEGSRMILTGDPSQIDDDFLSEQRNGLVWFAKLMKGDPIFAYTYFPQSVRSPAVQTFLRRLQAQRNI